MTGASRNPRFLASANTFSFLFRTTVSPSMTRTTVRVAVARVVVGALVLVSSAVATRFGSGSTFDVQLAGSHAQPQP
jgi:hypothetical protein